MKLPKIKTLEAKVWLLCKEITRLRYPHKCVVCEKDIEGKRLHTGHLFRKKFIPLQMKYDLRILRPQCPFDNMRMHGNEAWYSWYIVKNHGADYFLQIGEDIKKYQKIELSLPEKRQFLLSLVSEYQQVIQELSTGT